MTPKEQLQREIDRIPEPLLTEALDFVRFLRVKRVEVQPQAPAFGRPLLQVPEDWATLQEDQAWRDR